MRIAADSRIDAPATTTEITSGGGSLRRLLISTLECGRQHIRRRTSNTQPPRSKPSHGSKLLPSLPKTDAVRTINAHGPAAQFNWTLSEILILP